MSYINYYEYNPTQETLYKRVYDPTINRVDLQYIVGYRNGIPLIRHFSYIPVKMLDIYLKMNI